MNEQTLALLDKLAEKLGTTSEFLWAALVKQAFVEGVVYLLQIAGLIYGGVWLYRWFRAISVNEWDEIKYLPLGVVASVYGIVVIVAFFSLPMLAASFINPEYWALKEVLSAIRPR